MEKHLDGQIVRNPADKESGERKDEESCVFHELPGYVDRVKIQSFIFDWLSD